jgi:hypothetical protein
MYAKCRDFRKVALAYKIHRPDVRRGMSRAAKHLLGSNETVSEDVEQRDPEELALGAYIHGLIDKANPAGAGKSKREIEKKAGLVFLKDPPCLGEFRVDVKDPGFYAMFTSRANR